MENIRGQCSHGPPPFCSQPILSPFRVLPLLIWVSAADLAFNGEVALTGMGGGGSTNLLSVALPSR